ncbi:MAG: NADH:ubiquinone oxidoreductase, subunit RnfA [Oscillospiraceae bacterium]|nr:NADH:ubiquinone oxidoreductase, subunit RnfA [Oscillospiraceae bacterium]
MNQVLNSILTFFAYSVLAIGAQNVIFTRGLGLSSGLRMINDPRKDTLYFCGALTFFQIINSMLVYFISPVINRSFLSEYSRFITPVLIVVCCALSYMIVVFGLGMTIKKSTFRKIIHSLTGASINSAIVGTIILTLSSGFDLIETIGFAFGSSIGYFLAMLLISEGERKLRHDLIPENFRGLPVTLIYISVLALAVYGLTGHSMAL